MPLVLRTEKDRLRLIMNVEARDIRLMRKIVEIWLDGLKADDFSKLAAKLCVHEAVNNSVLHAYPGVKKTKKVEVDIEVSSGNIQIRVKDFGKNRWADSVLTGGDSDLDKMMSEKAHGRGLVIMRKVSKDFRVTNLKNKGSLVQMAVPIRYPAIS